MENNESGGKDSKARRWLKSFSQRVRLYADVLDVFVQHHPEYVALVWGAMKFLFTAVINHEKVVSKLAEALSHIADSLPRIELAANLYPTERMQTAVAELIAHILRFLIRAHDWYQGSTWKHVIHSITQPSELRYDDLLELISRSSAVVHGLAVSGQQVEFRYRHSKVDEINSKVDAKFGQVTSRLEEIGTAMSCKLDHRS
ncbi:hypothetical protein B0O99DRAFT_748479 [Bisporella sp. PMI_857]|nr:hypothetical protein B0O99DRAFT_748479 [Bisporella sp. PMI_857]